MPINATGLARIAAVLLILCLLAAMLFALRAGVSNLAFFSAGKEVSLWGREDVMPTQESIASAEDAITFALSWWPRNPEYLNLAAQIQGWKGYTESVERKEPALAVGYYLDAIGLLQQSLLLRPAHAETWALLAEYKALAGQRDAQWHQAREKALKLGGADIDLVERMLKP